MKIIYKHLLTAAYIFFGKSPKFLVLLKVFFASCQEWLVNHYGKMIWHLIGAIK